MNTIVNKLVALGLYRKLQVEDPEPYAVNTDPPNVSTHPAFTYPTDEQLDEPVIGPDGEHLSMEEALALTASLDKSEAQ